MTEYRPELLPFALPTTIGLPFHGLVKNGKLTFGADEIEHPQPDSGDTNLVQHPLATAVSRTMTEQAQDTLRHYDFRDYAIISGITREIGGKKLGANRYNWIYCDSSRSWRLSIVYSSTIYAFTATIWLEDVFGILGNDSHDMERRVLSTYSFNFKDYAGANTTTGVSYLHVTHSKTGGVTAVNVVAGATKYAKTAGICHSFKITVSGDGRVDEGHVGENISASCQSLADAPAMVSTTDETTGTDLNYANGEGLPLDWTTIEQVAVTVPPEDCAALGPGTHLLTTTETRIHGVYPDDLPLSGSYSTHYVTDRSFLYCATPEGSIINVHERYEKNSLNAGERSGSIINDPEVLNINRYNLGPCPSYFRTFVDAWSDGSWTSAFTGITSGDESYSLTFGDYSKSLSYDWARTKESGYTYFYDVQNPVGDDYTASFIGTYTDVYSSDTGVPDSRSWNFSTTGTQVSIKTNNVIKFSGEGSSELVSILNTTKTSSDAYVTLEPSTGVISTDSVPVCYV